jgi:hypothetical protein
MRLVRSCRRVKEGRRGGFEDKDKAGADVRAGSKILKRPETNRRLVSFLLLPSHRGCGIFGMGFP